MRIREEWIALDDDVTRGTIFPASEVNCVRDLSEIEEIVANAIADASIGVYPDYFAALARAAISVIESYIGGPLNKRNPT